MSGVEDKIDIIAALRYNWVSSTGDNLPWDDAVRINFLFERFADLILENRRLHSRIDKLENKMRRYS